MQQTIIAQNLYFKRNVEFIDFECQSNLLSNK